MSASGWIDDDVGEHTSCGQSGSGHFVSDKVSHATRRPIGFVWPKPDPTKLQVATVEEIERYGSGEP